MPVCTILVGPPGSGKSTYYKDNVWELDSCYINQDTQGKEGHLAEFYKAINAGRDILVDRMNFNKQQRDRYISKARQAGYQIHMIVFFVPRDTCFGRCLYRIKSENHPTITSEEIANKALDHFFLHWEKPTPEEYDFIEYRTQYSSFRTKAMIVDLDGTLANIDHRLHYVRREPGIPKDWDSFFGEIPNDTINPWCEKIIEPFQHKDEPMLLVLCSGRPEDYRKQTKEWLKDNEISVYSLYMRPKGDKRQDWIVKEMILDFELLPKYEILCAIDDRKQVVDMWRRRGIVCLQCAEGDF